MLSRFARRHTRKSEPRLPSLAGPALSSGATRRSQEIVRIAAASLSVLLRREVIRLVAISCMAESACAATEEIRGEEGYKACRRRM